MASMCVIADSEENPMGPGVVVAIDVADGVAERRKHADRDGVIKRNVRIYQMLPGAYVGLRVHGANI